MKNFILICAFVVTCFCASAGPVDSTGYDANVFSFTKSTGKLSYKDTVEIKNGTTSQRWNFYNTYIDASNYKRLGIYFSSGDLVLSLDPLGTPAGGGDFKIRTPSNHSLRLQFGADDITGSYFNFSTTQFAPTANRSNLLDNGGSDRPWKTTWTVGLNVASGFITNGLGVLYWTNGVPDSGIGTNGWLAFGNGQLYSKTNGVWVPVIGSGGSGGGSGDVVAANFNHFTGPSNTFDNPIYPDGGVIVPATPNPNTNAVPPRSTVIQDILANTIDLLNLTNTATTIFGVSTDGVPVRITLSTGTTLTHANKTNATLTASGGSASALVFTNLYVRDTNALIIDPAIGQTWSFGWLTNGIILFSNTPAMLSLACHEIEVNWHEWTNGGAKALAFRNLSGNLATNGTWVHNTNNNVTDKLIFRLADGTGTNLVLSVITNCSTYADTNSLLAGGGGGGSACTTTVGGIANIGRYWNFDEGTGSSTVDAVNSVTGTLVGSPVWISGKEGASALTFATRLQYVTSSTTLATTAEQTFAAWVNPISTAGASGHNIIVSGNTVNNWMEINSSGHLVYHCYENNVEKEDVNTTISTGVWTHVAVTVTDLGGGSGFSCKFYINGTLDDTQTSGQGLNGITQSYDISTVGGGGGLGFVGSLDGVLVGTRALTGGEISSLATCN